jgi:hypothetical protein
MKTIKHIVLVVLLITALTASSNKNNTYFNGKSNGFEVHINFYVLFTDPAYTCHGYKAMSSFDVHKCKLCGEEYYSQQFETLFGKEEIIYSNIECSKSTNPFHDNLDLDIIHICDCPYINIKKDNK